MSSRFFYLCRANFSKHQDLVEGKVIIGAASRKVILVTKALRSVGVRAAIVTCPLVPNGRTRELSFRERDVPVASLRSVGAGAVSRFAAGVGFAFFVLFKARRPDKVLLYNFGPEYILAALVLMLLGRRAIMDVEDAPNMQIQGVRKYVDVISFRILKLICSGRYLVVSKQVARRLRLANAEVVYGTYEEIPRSRDVFSDSDEIVVVFGGSLTPETGLELFCDALLWLARGRVESRPRMHFVVTGFGGEEAIQKLRAQLIESQIKLDYLQNIAPEEYRALLGRADVGLSLKLAGSSMGDTTFPSKVIELASAGLLLITTPVSDVPEIFGCENAVVLAQQTGQELAEALLTICRDPVAAAARALAGQTMVRSRFSEKEIGSRVVNHFQLSSG